VGGGPPTEWLRLTEARAHNAVARRHRLGRALVALSTTLVLAGGAAHTVHALDGCKPVLEVAEEMPGCCSAADADRITGADGDCCSSAELGETFATATSSPTPDVPGAVATVLPLDALVAVSLGNAGPIHPRDERPPDRTPPTDTTVLLL